MWSLVQKRQISSLVALEGRRKSKLGSTSVGQENCGPEESRPRDETEKQKIHDDDRITVATTGEEDPIDPRNWSLHARSKNIALLCFLIFTQTWAGAADSMGNELVSREFGVSKVAENLSTAMYLFGVGSGALFAGPVSESAGRNPTYLASTFVYLLFILGSGLTPTFGGQVVCRFFVGLFSSPTLAINGSSVGDQFRPVKRAFVFPVIAWANLAGPTIAPIVGGWVATNPHLGWRWTRYITLIISAAAWVMAVILLPETYLPVLLNWKAKSLRRKTGDKRYVAEHVGKDSLFQRTKRILPLPAKFFATEPVVAILGAYLILLYTILYTFLSGFDYIFKETYSMSTGQTGSCFGAIAAGETVATLAAPALYAWSRSKTNHQRGAYIQPEFRLWPAVITGPLLPVALFWLGWTNYPTISKWSSLGACVLFGVVLISIYVSSYEYIIDSYGEHAASALASITMARYLVAGGMVMAARPMYEGIGVHWTLTLMGCISVLLAPMPLLFKKYGVKLRKRSTYAEKERQSESYSGPE